MVNDAIPGNTVTPTDAFLPTATAPRRKSHIGAGT